MRSSTLPRHARWTRRYLGGLALVLAVASVSCRRRDEPTKPALSATALAERLEQATKSLVELDVNAARQALEGMDVRHPDVERLRARLALALGDCEGASTLLSSLAGGTPTAAPGAYDPAVELRNVADGCARAMAGARVLVDDERGVWVRFQNQRDEALMPLIADVADRAATSIGKHLRTSLPRPIRIELVSDLLSLAKVTGLPLEAAETTGTIAIARWGKVTLVSPRATPDGYPWQDTLAHELTHLLVTRQSSDSAPLWLQEGIAKREETRWRGAMPFDGVPDPHHQARRALLEGRSVGIDRLGPSLALLPTPEAAETAYAEVADFLDYWIQNNGEAALVLMLRDFAGLAEGSSDRAMVSVSGYGLREWMLRWQHALVSEGQEKSEKELAAGEPSPREEPSEAEPQWDLDVARRARLGELSSERHHYDAAANQLRALATLQPMPPELAYQQALVESALGDSEAARRFIEPTRVTHLDGAWLAMRGRILATAGDGAAAELAFTQSLAFAPTLKKVACRGFLDPDPSAARDQRDPLAQLPGEPWVSLCRSALPP